ncbi:hypothetical protein JKI95_06990 [Corynebacterium aquatimens]|nr:hypothetical protein JKI95_06990 [Corynebacterium aquatimens]
MQLTKQQLGFGPELRQLVETTARNYRPVDETQPVGEAAEEIAGTAKFAHAMLRDLRSARDGRQAESFALLLLEACRAALKSEPRFAVAFFLARAVWEKTRNLESVERLDEYLDEIERALPQRGGNAMVLQMPLFQLSEPGAWVFTTMFVGGAEYTIELKAQRPVYGVLRAIGLALEGIVERHNAPAAVEVYRTFAYARALLELAQGDAYFENEYLGDAVDNALLECADTLLRASEEFGEFNEAVSGGDYEAAAELLPRDVLGRVGGAPSPEEVRVLNESLEAVPGRTVVVFFNPGGDQHAELPMDWVPELEDFTPVWVPWLSTDHFAIPTTQAFRTRF